MFSNIGWLSLLLFATILAVICGAIEDKREFNQKEKDDFDYIAYMDSRNNRWKL